MHLKKHIRMNKFADLDMSIFYFKRRPFVVMDLLNEKIYFNENGLEWLRTKSNLNCPINGFEVNICHPKIGSDLL